MRHADIFGIKDPAASKLLPLWNEAFEYLGIDVSYIIIIRNPLSIADSLEKSYLMWLVHIMPALIETIGKKRVIVDYDNLLEYTENEIKNIAGRLKFQISQEKFQEYKNSFIDVSLRHSIYKYKDILSDGFCLPLIKEIYDGLYDVAKNKTDIDDETLNDKLAEWNNELNRFKIFLSYFDKISEKEKKTIKKFNNDLSRIYNYKSWLITKSLRISNKYLKTAIKIIKKIKFT